MNEQEREVLEAKIQVAIRSQIAGGEELIAKNAADIAKYEAEVAKNDWWLARRWYPFKFVLAPANEEIKRSIQTIRDASASLEHSIAMLRSQVITPDDNLEGWLKELSKCACADARPECTTLLEGNEPGRLCWQCEGSNCKEKPASSHQ